MLVKPAAKMAALEIEKYEDTKQEVTLIGSIEEQEVHRSTSVSTTSEQVLSVQIYAFMYDSKIWDAFLIHYITC